VAGLDVARALAVVGMFGAHVGAVSADVDVSPASWSGVVNGRSSVLFAVLAGVSIALLSGRTSPVAGADLARARTRIFVRAAWVFAIGGLLEALGTDIEVILGVYALLFVLSLPFLRWSPRRLLITAGVLAVLAPPVDLLLMVSAQATETDTSPLMQLAVTGPYPAVIWSTFVLVGLAIGRCDLGSTTVQARLAVAGVGLAFGGYGAGWLTTQWWGSAASAQAWVDGDVGPRSWQLAWLAGAAPHSGTTFEIVGSVGVALTVIAGCLLVADRFPRITFPLAAVGTMALTAYSGHVVAGALFPVEGNGVWLGYVLVTVLAATVWRLTVGQGPLERLLTWSSTRVAPAVATRC
jgi:uncharacterized membrane protein YeiB